MLNHLSDILYMNIHILYFASIREQLGSGEVLSLPMAATVGHARLLLASRSALHAEVLSPQQLVRCALNQVLCDETAVLDEGAELAFFPPLTGG
jgi:sulfur-carrier protein